ncbi:MAG TPA: cytochrome b [Thiolinea sp.]|nr:cytochrome b [Thiolinea sp.]
MSAVFDTTEIEPEKYSKLAVSLHWIMALLVLVMIPLGWYMMEIEDNPGSDWYFMLHKSLGLVFFLLLLVRFFWRLTHKAPPSESNTWQDKAAKVVHFLLYTVMFALPILGLIGAQLSEEGVSFFGIALPHFLTPNDDLAEVFFELHGIGAWVLIGLVAIHTGAALKHLFLDKDGVFQRMWF